MLKMWATVTTVINTALAVAGLGVAGYAVTAKPRFALFYYGVAFICVLGAGVGFVNLWFLNEAVRRKEEKDRPLREERKRSGPPKRRNGRQPGPKRRPPKPPPGPRRRQPPRQRRPPSWTSRRTSPRTPRKRPPPPNHPQRTTARSQYYNNSLRPQAPAIALCQYKAAKRPGRAAQRRHAARRQIVGNVAGDSQS